MPSRRAPAPWLRSGIWSLLALAAIVFATACSTLTPLETASTVRNGRWRVEPQLTLPVWCSFGTDPDVCHQFPEGPTSPQLRLGVRRGFAHGLELGGAAHALYGDEYGFEPGAMVQGRAELWSLDLGEGRRTVVSTGLAAGYTRLDSHGEASFAVPVLFGFQTPSFEWVAGGRFVERVAFGYAPTHGPVAIEHFGLNLGMFHRSGFALQLGYETPFRYADAGSFSLTAGWLLDFGEETP